MFTIKSWHVVGFILLAGIGIYIFSKNRPQGSVSLGEPTIGNKPRPAGGFVPPDTYTPGAKSNTVGFASEYQ